MVQCNALLHCANCFYSSGGLSRCFSFYQIFIYSTFEMKENIICYYPYSVGYKNSYCGTYYDDIEEHTAILERVSCKKCLKIMKQKQNERNSF